MVARGLTGEPLEAEKVISQGKSRPALDNASRGCFSSRRSNGIASVAMIEVEGGEVCMGRERRDAVANEASHG